MQPFLDSSDAIEDGPELAVRMDRDGYLFVRGLIPVDVVENLRMQILDIAQQAGWVKQDVPLEDAVADLNGFCVEPEPTYMQTYHQMYVLPDFHAFQHHPSILGLLERMAGEAILPHPRLIGRTIFPQKNAFTTPPHQDFIPIQGTPDTYTAWVPLTDVPAQVGGLQVAAGSHKKGVYDFRPALGAGGLAVIDPLDGTWVSSPFEQGDVLFFHSMAVHKGLPNQSDKLRMSMDARYQRASDPIAPGSLEPHSQPHTWEEIYADWPHDSLKYYWENLVLDIKAYDNQYHDKRDEMAWEMAEAGDVRALSTMQRIIARDLDPAKRARAETLLADLEAKVNEA
ncbi:MAG: phytanoyl-CoA dioxygenase family protein [Chloroflexota bacterium]